MEGLDKEKKFDEKFDSEFQEHWLPLLKTHGKFDEHKIRNEMRDLLFIYEQVAEVYCTITGGLLSKSMYYANTIITKYEEQLQNEYNAGLKDGKGDNEKQK